MSHAPLGALWCEYAVARAAGRRWTFAELPPVRVKGKAGLIRVYEPTTPFERRDAPTDSPLVGRGAEQAQLAALLDAVVEGESRLVVLEGEAGIGKSRLVEELARLTGLRGLVGLVGFGQSIERHTPYRAWRDIVGSFFDLDSLEDVAAQRARVETTLASLRPDLLARLPLLNDLLHLDIPETPQTRLLDPAQRGESLNTLLIELLHSWAREQPLILVLEDAHWFDSRSWDVTVRVARALSAAQQPLLMLVTTRPVTVGGSEDAAFQTLLSLQGATHMRLGALPIEAILTLAAARMGLQPDELAGEVASLIQTRSGGNPFFAEELVDTLRQRALIQLDRDDTSGTSRYVASPALVHNEQLLPDTLQGLLLERIDRLPPDERLTLKVAAVIGATFAYPPLRYARTRGAGMNDVALRQHLGTLVAQDFTALAADEPELAYRFKHILAQEAAYQTLLYAQRRMLHRTLAEWYEGGSSVPAEDSPPSPLDDRRSPLLPLLAHHYRHAEDAERERHYARLAGIQAADQYANDEALAYFSRALALTLDDDLAGRFDLLRGRLEIHAHQEQQTAVADELDRLEPLADALNDDARRAYCAMRRAMHDARGGDYARGIAAAQQALALAQAAGETGIAIDAHRIWGNVLTNQGDFAEAQAQYEIALRLARAQGERIKEARLLNNIGCCLLFADDQAAAEQYFQVCLHLCYEIGDRYVENLALRNLGEIARSMGDYTAARDYKIKSLAVARAIGITTAERVIPMDLGELAQAMGDYDAAQAAYQESLRLINAVGDPDNECLVLYDMARLFWKWDQYPAARSYAQRAIDIARTIGNGVTETVALIALGHIELALGQVEAARRIYQTVHEKSRARGQSLRVLEAEAGLARVALAGGDLSGALVQVHSILTDLETVSLGGADEPFLIELTCYQVLEASGDQRAPTVLQALYARFQQALESISNEAERRMFLENVPAHREIVASWRALQKKSATDE